MYINIVSQESNYNILDNARKIADTVANIDPSYFIEDSYPWVNTENQSIRFCREQRSMMNFKLKKYQGSCKRSALIRKKKYYELVSEMARIMLCRLQVVMEGSDHGLDDPAYETLKKIALLLILDSHNKWKDGDDLTLTVPDDLDQDKKDIIDSYLRVIHSLDVTDESEGTYAYLLHDYCRTMILYNCAAQLTYGADPENVRNVYGEYTDEALRLYDSVIGESEAGDETEDI